jgi:hypothetical protein
MLCSSYETRRFSRLLHSAFLLGWFSTLNMEVIVPPKRRFTYGLHSGISVTTAVRTLNPTWCKLFSQGLAFCLSRVLEFYTILSVNLLKEVYVLPHVLEMLYNYLHFSYNFHLVSLSKFYARLDWTGSFFFNVTLILILKLNCVLTYYLKSNIIL